MIINDRFEIQNVYKGFVRFSAMGAWHDVHERVQYNL